MRLSWGVSAVVLLASFSIATIALQHASRQLQKSINEDQYRRLSAIADAIDLKFQSRRTLLKTLADHLASVPLGTADELQRYIERYQSVRPFFDNISFIDPDGNVVANLNTPVPFGMVNVADREYFQRTVQQAAGVVSQPYQNKISGLAQISLTEPVWNADGTLRYVLYGAINLKDQNFLGSLNEVKFGETGYLFILNTQGIIIDLPDKSRILQHVDAQGGSNPVTQRALAGFEGITSGATRAGIPGLFAFKRTQQTDWILGAFYPEAEALAPIEAIEKNAWLGALAVSILAGLLAMVVIRQQLKPLSALHERMRHLETAVPQEDSTYRQDEIGELSLAFDDLMRRQMAAEWQVRTIIDNIPALVSHVDTQYRYTFVNARVRDMYPDDGELVGRTVQSVRGEEFFERVQPYLDRALAGENVVLEKTGSKKDGGFANTYQAHYVPDVDMHGQVRGVFALSFDTSALTAALREQETSQRFLRTITDNLPVLISYIDRGRRIIFANATVKEWLGMSPEEISGTPLQEVIGEERYTKRLEMLEAALAGRRVEFESELHVHGRHRITRSIYVPDVGKDQQVRGVFSLTMDITEAKAIEQKLAQLARQDGLTGLHNRTALDEMLEMALARSQRTSAAMAVMYLDIDFFKQINDQLGHGVGDAILMEFANRLQNAVRVTDCVFRLGGDEFVVLLENIGSEAAAVQVAQKIGALIRDVPFDAAPQLRVTASIGVYTGVPAVGASAKEFLDKADAALYRAKAAGRDCFHCESAG